MLPNRPGGSLLLFDVLAHHADRGAAARSSEVGWRPEYALVVVTSGDIRSFGAEHSAGSAFEAVDQRRDCHLRLIADQKMDVVLLAVHLHQFCVEVAGNFAEQFSQPFDGLFVEDLATVFCDKDQMNVKVEYAVSSMTNIVAFCHRPNYNPAMQRRQAYKFEVEPNGEQQRAMRRFAGDCRFVYNRALELQKKRYERGEKKLGYAGLCKELTEWKSVPDWGWLNQTPSQTLQQTLQDLERAYANFFAKRAAFPHRRKKGRSDSFRYPQGVKLDQPNRRVFLPRLGWVRYRHSREVLGKVKNVTVSHSCGKWYVSIQTERTVEEPVHPSDSIVGLDLGVARLATQSDGTVFEPVNSFKRHEKALAKAQRAMARKKKYSRNWKKAKARIQRIHTRIANVRRDYLHKTTTTISKNHAIVCIEDLQVKNMSRSAAGNIEQPGRNVRAKSALNKSILDQGWHEFRRQLEYKLCWLGGQLVTVPPNHTSRTCPECGHVSAENRRTQAQFVCKACSYQNHADLVGAINVRRAGLARIACEVSGEVMSPAAGTHRSESGMAQCQA